MGGELREVQVNWDELREISNVWIRRASVFMGIGANAARIQPPISHVLDDRAQFHFTTQTPTEKEAKLFVSEFDVWVVANGLRELVEGHSTFLDAVYGRVVLLKVGRIKFEELQKLERDFERKSVSEKRERVTEELGIDDPFADMFQSMNQCRNCLAHRNGVVGWKDVDANRQMDVRWRTLGFSVGGERIDLNRGDREFHVKEGGELTGGPIDVSRTFALGEQIRLTRHDLGEICMGFHMAGETILSAMAALAATKGLLPRPDATSI